MFLFLKETDSSGWLNSNTVMQSTIETKVSDFHSLLASEVLQILSTAFLMGGTYFRKKN